MTERKAYRPKRSVRSELVSLALLFSLPAAIALVFPWPAIGWTATERPATKPACRFVTLSEKGEAAHLEAAKSAWLLKGAARRDRWIDLAVGELPAASVPQAMPKRELPPEDALSRANRRFRLDLMPPTAAAGSPAVIPAEKPVDGKRPAFSREELLENDLINDMKGK